MAGKRTTIKDIAEALGLSVATVSRALTDSWEVSKKTRAAVLEMAEKLNYHPNSQARGLVTRRSNTVGLVVPDLLTSTYFATVAKSIQPILMDRGYHLLITQSDESPAEERRLLRMLQDINVDGIIVSTSTDADHNRDIFNELLSEGTALVFVSRVCHKVKAPKIVIDNKAMAERVVRHLIDQGCKQIVHIAGPKGIRPSLEREQGYRKALEAHRISLDERLVVPAGLFEKDGAKAMHGILDAGLLPDAVFAFNDTVAFGAMKEIKRRGLRIPQDIAVAGFSNSFAATIIEPPLTTVAQPLPEMGKLAAELLLRQLDGFEAPDKTVILDSELIIRASSLKASM